MRGTQGRKKCLVGSRPSGGTLQAARLAHARASTTLNVCAHAVPGGDRHAAQQLSRLLAEVMSDSVKLKALEDVG
jgi:hypothetical protein